MINVLINAYAVSPNWGSEQGMGWNWIINIAKYCNVDVITEGEWQNEIEEAVSKLHYKDNIKFHYLPLSDKVRKMCWDQGDWRFYWYYRKWQKQALHTAEKIIATKKIDVIHQLNMIGFREPGYLWKIPNIPFVWGPIGGMELMPMTYLKDAPWKQRIFNTIKNKINQYQYTHSSRVIKAINRADLLISAVKGVKDVLCNIYNMDSLLINETGVNDNLNAYHRESDPDKPLKLIWVGKFDFRKQLQLALRSLAAVKSDRIELHICGTGNDEVVCDLKSLAEQLGIASQCFWYGNVDHDKITGMMAAADILFFTSIMDATSTVVLEAVSVDLPTLCFNTCGFGQIVKDFAGFTIELSDPETSVNDFAEKLDFILNHRTVIDSISTKIAKNKYALSWDEKARTMFEYYTNIVFNQKTKKHNNNLTSGNFSLPG